MYMELKYSDQRSVFQNNCISTCWRVSDNKLGCRKSWINNKCSCIFILICICIFSSEMYQISRWDAKNIALPDFQLCQLLRFQQFIFFFFIKLNWCWSKELCDSSSINLEIPNEKYIGLQLFEICPRSSLMCFFRLRSQSFLERKSQEAAACFPSHGDWLNAVTRHEAEEK